MLIAKASDETDRETEIALIESAWVRIREHLENERRRVNEEIRNYPPPIPACDAQFNYLLEERVRILQELDRLKALALEGLTGSDQHTRIDEFIASSNYINGEMEQSIRSSQKKSFILCAAFLLGSLTGESASFANFVAQASRAAHRHPRLSDVSEQILTDVEIAEVVLDKSATKENLARSRYGRYEAFTSYQPDQSPSLCIYFVERGTSKVYEIRGLPLPHRPFSDLAWVNNSTLVFDRWSQPHYGIHYVVNVRSKKLVGASAFPDEFYLEQQRPKPRSGKKSSSIFLGHFSDFISCCFVFLRGSLVRSEMKNDPRNHTKTHEQAKDW